MARRASERGREHLRVARDYLAVAAGVADDPDSGNPVRTSLAGDRNRELLGLRDLPPGAAHRGVDVAERVPALLDEQDPQRVVAHADVYRKAWIGRLGGKLEGSLPAGQSAMSERQLLDPKVPRVLRLMRRVAPQLDT